jgi:hypothetical protein
VRRRRIVTVAALAVGLGGLLAIVGIGYHVAHRDLAFDQSTWMQPVGWCEHSPRGRMVDDLVKRHLPHGLDTKRVRRLLGPPDDVSDYGTVWWYSVDREDEFFLDTCVSLEVVWTHGNRLERAEVLRDD